LSGVIYINKIANIN